MHGGFFTGMVVKWECTEPFVPVDCTVNVCSVGIYRVTDGPEDAEAFAVRIEAVRQMSRDDCSYEWNFEKGNHFITLAEAGPGQSLPVGRYLVLHSSACEFKSQRNGLYPTKNNWYSQHIEVTEDESSGRYLRFLRGASAERFFRHADQLVAYNQNRLHYFAEAILGRQVTEVLYVPHYGMPDSESVAIGCQWLSPTAECVLLTAPGQDLLVIEPIWKGANKLRVGGQERILMPHGLGVTAGGALKVVYMPDGIKFNEQFVRRGGSLKSYSDLSIRGVVTGIHASVERVLHSCPARIVARLHPICSNVSPHIRDK